MSGPSPKQIPLPQSHLKRNERGGEGGTLGGLLVVVGEKDGAGGSKKKTETRPRTTKNHPRHDAAHRPATRCARSYPSPLSYHCTKRKGLTFYLRRRYCRNIDFNCCPAFPPLRYRTSLRRLLKVMEHNDVSERPLKLRSGVGQCEHSAT